MQVAEDVDSLDDAEEDTEDADDEDDEDDAVRLLPSLALDRFLCCGVCGMYNLDAFCVLR